MSPRSARPLAAVTALVTLAMVAMALILFVLVLDQGEHQDLTLGSNGFAILTIGFTYPIVGWLIASRRPENPIGWIFLAVCLSMAAEALSGPYAQYGLVTNPGSLPLADLASWVTLWAWVPGLTLLFVLILLFPDGRLPSSRWRPGLWVAAAGAVLAAVPFAATVWPYRGLALLTEKTPTDTSIAVAATLQAVGVILILLVGLTAVRLVASRGSTMTTKHLVRIAVAVKPAALGAWIRGAVRERAVS